jgi:hypothetical protein
MKTLQLIPIFIMLFVLVACNTDQTAPIVDDITIELAVEPDPPTTGESTLLVTVLDKEGNPMEDAHIAVHGDMDHEGMTPSDSESSEGSKGVYRVPFDWSMGGGWILDITVTLPDNGGTATEKFELFVGAISENSIVNQGDTDTAEMDHDAMGSIKSDIQIHYMPDNDPALAGDATITIVLTTQDGLPIDDASVALHATMPEHNMMPVTGTGDVGEKGRYSIPVRWTMAGNWEVDIAVNLSDMQEISRAFTQIVIMPEDSDTEMNDMSDHNSSD